MKRSLGVVLLFTVCIADVFAITPGDNWLDSYSADGQCYCYTSFDHDAGSIIVDTPAGPKTTREICGVIGPGPGVDTNPIYNDLQCGNGPPNSAADETLCPGRVDMGSAGCSVIGPTWNLDQYFSAPEEVDTGTNTPDPTEGEDSPETVSESGSTNEVQDTGATDPDTGTEPIIDTTQISIELMLLNDDLLFHAGDFSSKDDRWVLINAQWLLDQSIESVAIESRLSDSGTGQYVEVLPDTKVTDSDPVSIDSVWTTPGEGPQIQFDIVVEQAGVYEVYGRMFSTGSYDDAISVAVDGVWPASDNVLTTCAVHGLWTWSLCENSATATVSISTAGNHSLMFSAMHDGVELDQFVLRRVSDSDTTPEMAKAVQLGSGIGFGAGVLGLLSGSTLISFLLFRYGRRSLRHCG